MPEGQGGLLVAVEGSFGGLAGGSLPLRLSPLPPRSALPALSPSPARRRRAHRRPPRATPMRFIPHALNPFNQPTNPLTPTHYQLSYHAQPAKIYGLSLIRSALKCTTLGSPNNFNFWGERRHHTFRSCPWAKKSPLPISVVVWSLRPCCRTRTWSFFDLYHFLYTIHCTLYTLLYSRPPPRVRTLRSPVSTLNVCLYLRW